MINEYINRHTDAHEIDSTSSLCQNSTPLKYKGLHVINGLRNP